MTPTDSSKWSFTVAIGSRRPYLIRMMIKKILAALSVVALLAATSGFVFADEVDPEINEQNQIFKTGRGAASGQGGLGATGGLSTGAIAAGIAVAAVLAVGLVAASDDDAPGTTTTTTTTTTTN